MTKLARAVRDCSLFVLLTLASACGKQAVTSLDGAPAGPYRLNLALAPPAPGPGDEATLTFHLSHTATGEPLHDLQVIHERVLHTFIVARDFSSFAHIHHEDFLALTAADLTAATLHFPYRFPHVGHYRIVSEFVYRDRTWIKQFDLSIGNPHDEDVVKINLAREQTVGPYRARLAVSPAQPVAGAETELILELARDGQPVTDLKLFLGTEAHVALWRIDGENFGHTHSYTPEMAAMMAAMHGHVMNAQEAADMMLKMMSGSPKLNFPGPRVPVHYTFPSPGVYALFIQVAPRGEPRVFGFMLEVKDTVTLASARAVSAQ